VCQKDWKKEPTLCPSQCCERQKQVACARVLRLCHGVERRKGARETKKPVGALCAVVQSSRGPPRSVGCKVQGAMCKVQREVQKRRGAGRAR
jgi:hypothetical protein